MAIEYVSHIGCLVNLLSISEVRYEGIISLINLQDSIIGLKNARCYGTEGRRRNGPEILPILDVFESIQFRTSDIKCLSQNAGQLLYDSSIIQADLIPQSPRFPILGQCQDRHSRESVTYTPSSSSRYQLSHSGDENQTRLTENVPSSMGLCGDPWDLVTLTPTQVPCDSLELLPSPGETPTEQLTEDFDIQAMNEKFEEDELKAEQGNLSEVVEDNKTGVTWQNLWLRQPGIKNRCRG